MLVLLVPKTSRVQGKAKAKYYIQDAIKDKNKKDKRFESNKKNIQTRRSSASTSTRSKQARRATIDISQQ